MNPEVNEQLGDEESSFVNDLGLGDETETTEKTEDTTEKETEETEEKTTEETTEETTEKTTEEATEKKEETEEEPDLDKDLTQEEINKLPKDAKGLYYSLKKEREKRKDAEAKLQYIEIHNKYGKKTEDKPKGEEPKEEFETVEDILKDKNPDDLLTVDETRRIEKAKENQRKAEERRAKAKTEKANAERQKERERIDELEIVFKSSHDDYDEIFSIFQQAVKEMPSLMQEVIAEGKRENGNPAKKAYELGRKFQPIYGKKNPAGGKPENDAQRALKNAEKKKPSGSVAGGGVSNEGLEEMDVEELGKALSAMSMAEFMKVPKRIRLKALR